VNTSSEGRAGSERRGELLKRWAESVVRQLNTVKRQVEIAQGAKRTYLDLESARDRHWPRT
jgi:hypothetical protein